MLTYWALQDTGRGEERERIFLTSLLPPDILRGSSRAAGKREENAGGVAQLGERLNGIQEVRGSIPLTSIREPDASIVAGLAKKRPAELTVTCRFGGKFLSVRLRELVKGFPWIRGNSSVGRAQPCQGWGRGFESRFPLLTVF